jgi:hypothetical protein
MNTNEDKYAQLNDEMLAPANGGGDGNYVPICQIAEAKAAALCNAAPETTVAGTLCDAVVADHPRIDF